MVLHVRVPGLVRSSPPAPRTGAKIDKIGKHIEIPRNIQNGVLWAPPPQPNTDSGFWGWGTGSGRQGPTGPSTEWVGSCGPPRTRQVGASLADTAVLALAESKQPRTAATQRVHGSGPSHGCIFLTIGEPRHRNKYIHPGGRSASDQRSPFLYCIFGEVPSGAPFLYCIFGEVPSGAGLPRWMCLLRGEGSPI